MSPKKKTPMESVGDTISGPMAVKPRKSKSSASASTKKSSPRKRATNKKAAPETAVVSASVSTDGVLRPSVSEYEQIALLAYSFWEARGRQGGSPEEDWFRAEAEFRRRRGLDRDRSAV